MKKARKLLERVVTVQTRVLAEEHRDLLWWQHELARGYLEDGKVNKAVELLRRVVAVRTRMLAARACKCISRGRTGEEGNGAAGACRLRCRREYV